MNFLLNPLLVSLVQIHYTESDVEFDLDTLIADSICDSDIDRLDVRKSEKAPCRMDVGSDHLRSGFD